MTGVRPKGTRFAGIAAVAVAVLLGVFSLSICCAVAADTVPDLKGTWQGKSQSVAVGKLGHTTDLKKPAFLSADFTLRIDAQEGRLVYGTKQSKKSTEQILGVISADGKSVYFADHDGYYMMTILAPDQLEAIYLEAGTKSRVASTTIYKRVK